MNLYSSVYKKYNGMVSSILNRYLSVEEKPAKDGLIFKTSPESFYINHFSIKNEYREYLTESVFKHITQQTFKYYLRMSSTLLTKTYIDGHKKTNSTYMQNKGQKTFITKTGNQKILNIMKIYNSLKDANYFLTRNLFSNISQRFVFTRFYQKADLPKRFYKEVQNRTKFQEKRFLGSHTERTFYREKTVETKKENDIIPISTGYLSKLFTQNIHLKTNIKSIKSSKLIVNRFIKSKNTELSSVNLKKIIERKRKDTLEVKKEREFEVLKREIEKIKTELLVGRNEDSGKSLVVENREANKVKKAEKNKLAEEIYEIVLRKWEKELIRRGILNG